MAGASFTWARWAAGTRRQRADTLARRREWLTHATTAALPVKEALDEGALAGVEARRRLALAVAGTFCALASVAGSAGQTSKDCCGLWGGPLVRPGAWSGDEAQQGLITTPLVHRHRVPAIFQNPQQLWAPLG